MRTSERILAIVGPTASGKTAAAIELARDLDGELVGCDSVQVYRGFDIGSAKPSAEELGGITHHLIDVIDPDQSIDAAEYAELADRAIAEIVARARVPIVVGGAGLWLRALLRGLVELPEPDPALRARLEEDARTLGAPALHARLAAVDPIAAAAIHPNDELRIVRALEVFDQTGRPLGELRAEHSLGAPRYDALVIAIDRERDDLYARIDARLDDMLAKGLLDEIRALLSRWPRGARAFGSVGYKEMVAHVLDGVPLETALAQARKATRIYTRRQRTWFASDPNVGWRTDGATLLSSEGRARALAFVGAGRGGPRSRGLLGDRSPG